MGLGQSMVPALLGVLLGSALQLQQSAIWLHRTYVLFFLVAFVLYGFLHHKSIAKKVGMNGGRVLILLAATLCAFGLTGLRAAFFSDGGLDPALEGRDVTVVGVMAAMPQRHEGVLRFRLDVESASAQGEVVRLPGRIDLSWYAGVQAGADGTSELQRQPADAVS